MANPVRPIDVPGYRGEHVYWGFNGSIEFAPLSRFFCSFLLLL